MLIDLAYIAVGLILLVFAGDLLVKGAVGLSLRLGIPALAVSLTVVAFGTSAPEMLVSVEATIAGATDLVYGNIVGSNIANILLVLGAPALIAPLSVCQKGVFRNFMIMLGASLLLIGVCALGGLTFWTGALFLAALTYVLYDTYHQARLGKVEVELEDGGEASLSWLKISAYILVGVIGLPIGAHLLIEGARTAAIAFGISEAAIGLTLVAVGTSLPELATTVMAAIRGRADVAIGNVIGSNIFNILAVFGVGALVGNLPTPAGFMVIDLPVMFAVALLLGPFIIKRIDINRLSGAAFCGLYVAYCVFALS